MRVARVQFTVRRLMFAVASAGLASWLIRVAVEVASELARKHCPAWSWVERAGFGAALITATAEGAMTMAEATRTIPVVAERLAYLTIWAAGWLVAFAVADVLVRSFGDLWKCWTEPQPALA
jgi:hypothetical protein